MKIAINCLSISTASALGVRTFLLTHLQQFASLSLIQGQDIELLIFVQVESALKPEIESMLANKGPRIYARIVEVAGITWSIWRVLYEQLVLPLHVRGCHIIYSINNVNPVLLFSGVKSVVTIHDLLPFKSGSRHGALQRTYIRLFSMLCARRATEIITVSHFTKREIVAYLNVSESKITVVYNCLLHPFVEAQECADNFLLVLGGLNEDKRVDLTLRGFAEFIAHYPRRPMRLVIAGPDQGARQRLGELALELGADSKVCFLGQVSGDRKNELLRSCSAIVMMGRNEGFGIPVLEAMRFGKPSLVADAGALPEVVGTAGIVVQTPESAEQLAEGIRTILESGPEWTKKCQVEYSRFLVSNESHVLWAQLFRVSGHEQLILMQT